MTELPSKGITRNFPGVTKDTYYTLADMQEKYRYEQSGTTDTDSKTDGSENKPGYAKVFQKSGKPHGHGGKELGLHV